MAPNTAESEAPLLRALDSQTGILNRICIPRWASKLQSPCRWILGCSWPANVRADHAPVAKNRLHFVQISAGESGGTVFACGFAEQIRKWIRSGGTTPVQDSLVAPQLGGNSDRKNMGPCRTLIQKIHW